MRSTLRWPALAFAALTLAGCAGPAASALPLIAQQINRQTPPIAAPTEDGFVYVAVTSGPQIPVTGLARAWRRTATEACHGEYLVFSESESVRQQAGRPASHMREGYVRCVSPEASEDVMPERSET